MNVGNVIMIVAIAGAVIRLFQWLNRKMDYSPKITQEKAGKLILSKDYVSAINILTTALEYYPCNGSLHFQRSIAYYESEQIEKALYDVIRAFELEYWVRSSSFCREHRNKIEKSYKNLKMG